MLRINGINGTDVSSEIMEQFRSDGMACTIILTVFPDFILIDPGQTGWNPNSYVNVGVSPSPADYKSATAHYPSLGEYSSFYIKLYQR